MVFLTIECLFDRPFVSDLDIRISDLGNKLRGEISEILIHRRDTEFAELKAQQTKTFHHEGHEAHEVRIFRAKYAKVAKM